MFYGHKGLSTWKHVEKVVLFGLVILDLTAARGLMLRSNADGRFTLGPTAGL